MGSKSRALERGAPALWLTLWPVLDARRMAHSESCSGQNRRPHPDRPSPENRAKPRLRPRFKSIFFFDIFVKKV